MQFGLHDIFSVVGPAEHASAPKPASAWQEYDDDADEFADMLGGHEDNEDDADDFRRQQVCRVLSP